MSQALYRKWRPARFDQVIGQEHVTRTLQNSVAADRVGHAYLFCGPRGTGKTTSARLLAKAVNCTHEDLSQRPCDQCPHCLALNQGRFLDLFEIDAASNTGVDDIRDLRDKINFAPSDGRFKVYIIDEVHMLSTAAFNALLKTLEEPPPHAKFVLATTEEHKVPLTIKSRCQQYNFRLLTMSEIVGRLQWLVEQENLQVEPDVLAMVARQGAGSLRDSESLLDQLISAPDDVVTLERAQMVLGTAPTTAIAELVAAWLQGDGAAGLRVIHDALSSGADARQFSRQTVAYLRHVLLLNAAGNQIELDLPDAQLKSLELLAKQANRAALVRAIKVFNEAAMAPGTSWQPQLPLELAFIESLPQYAPEPVPMVAPAPVAAVASPPPPVQPTYTPPPPQTVAPASSPAPAPVPTPESELAPVVSAGETSLSLAAATQQWPQMVATTRQRDRNLASLLANCNPLGIEGDTIVIGFKYPILKDKFDNKQGAQTLVAEVYEQVLGMACQVRTVVTGQYTPSAPAASATPAAPTVTAEAFAALAEELGGEVHAPPLDD